MMKRTRPKFLRYIVLLVAIAGSGAMLLYTSQSVQRQEERLAKIERAAEHERQMINVLEAEWARLNSPYNLEELTQRYLDLVPPDTAAITPQVPQFSAEDIASDILDGDDHDLKVEVSTAPSVIRPSKKPSYTPPKRVIPLKAEPASEQMSAPEQLEVEKPADSLDGLLNRLQSGGAE